MTTNAPRAPIDFDAFEREMRQPSQSDSAAPAPVRADPLAELARIVGQDDPFRGLLQNHAEQDRQAVPASGRRTEPTFADDSADRSEGQAPLTPADAFDQYLATVEQGAYAHERDADPRESAAFEQHDDAFPPPAPKRSNRRYLQVGAGLGVLVLCVTGALGWKSLSAHSSNGEPVTVLADKSPLKEAPPAADGVEIPDQNKQIYDRNAKDGQIKIVNREEQPIDVNQAIRTASRDSAGQGGATPGSGGMLTDSLGEPRRVRTVSVKPDTPPPAMQQRDAAAEPAPARVSPIPTMVMPDASDNNAGAAARRPSRPAPTRSVSAEPASISSAPQAAEVAPPQPTTQRVASVAPETTASTIEPSAASTASVGGFSVQLGVRSSESDARAAFRQMQTKYSQLSGKPELIRQAEVDGKSIYRVRVGPLGKTEANTLCSQLKGAGGQCFVAKN